MKQVKILLHVHKAIQGESRQASEAWRVALSSFISREYIILLFMHMFVM